MSPYAVMLAVFCVFLRTACLLLAWVRREDARGDAVVLRVLAALPAPMVGSQVARLSGVSTAYVTLARLEERGLVERHVDPPRTETLHGQTIEVYRAVLVHHHRRRARCTDPRVGDGAVTARDGPSPTGASSVV